MPDGRVLIALDNNALDTTVTWTRIDDTPNLVASIEISRGRQTEFDVTETSTATVWLNDTAGLFDPANTGSPYYGKIDGKQIMLQLRNPVTDTWVTQWRGHIDDFGYDFHPAGVVANVRMDCVDLFDYLANVEMIPGLFGDVPVPAGWSAGTVVYAQADFQTRLWALLDDAGIPSAMRVIFTGNVDVMETGYDGGDSVLSAVRDALDAEFPSIANAYCDKLGRVVAHGRFARFDPDTVAATGDWDFTRWKAGDGTAIFLDSTRAQIRPPLRWSRPRSRIINAALAYQRGITEADIPGQISSDAVSIAAYGYHSWSATDLLTAAGNTTGNNATLETASFGEYYVANYANPRTRVEQITFRSLRSDDPRASATWGLICGVDISDIIDLEHSYPGGVGISEEFYVEGSEMTIRPLTADLDDVELTVNVSPQAYYTTDPWT